MCNLQCTVQYMLHCAGQIAMAHILCYNLKRLSLQAEGSNTSHPTLAWTTVS